MADDTSDGSDKERNAPTVRDLKGPVLAGDTVPDMSGMYVPPRPPPETSQHRTVDLKSVRLSDQADPRRWVTERRLVSPVEPEASRSKLWIAGVAATLLLGGLAWALLREAVPSSSPPAPAVRPPADPAAAVPKATSPARATASARLGVKTSKAATPGVAPSPSAQASSLPPQKAPRPKEPTKKRKDPWLE